MELIPSILTNDPAKAKAWLKRISESGKFSRVQIDFVDGKYANNLTVVPSDIDLRESKNLRFDAHLMVTEENLQEYADAAKVSGYDRIIPQLESISSPEKFGGLAMDIHSPVTAILPYLEKLEVVVVMAVEPGFGGQKFIEEVIKKVGQFSQLRNLRNLRFKICVDGGVEKRHLDSLEKAGTNEVVGGVEKILTW